MSNVPNPAITAAVAAVTAATTAAASRGEEGFKPFVIADKQLINPGTKSGRALLDTFAKSDVKVKDKSKGRLSEVEAFRKSLKSIATKLNKSNVMRFTHDGKDHDLANAPERRTIAELHNYNESAIWSFDGIARVNCSSSTVSLHDKAKSVKDKKQKLRKQTNICAHNQIILKIIKELTLIFLQPFSGKKQPRKFSNRSILTLMTTQLLMEPCCFFSKFVHLQSRSSTI